MLRASEAQGMEGPKIPCKKKKGAFLQIAPRRNIFPRTQRRGESLGEVTREEEKRNGLKEAKELRASRENPGKSGKRICLAE